MPYSLKQKIGLVLLLTAVMIISAAVILSQEGRAPAHPMDQAFVTTADLRIGQHNGVWYFHYPHLQWAGGITASLAVGLYKLIVPASPETLNYHIKILAMLLFFLFSYLLASQYLKTRQGLFLFIAIIATSGFQLIEPTNELIAATYLLAFFYGMAKKWNFIITTLLLVCFGLCKAELPLVAGAMMLYWVWVTPDKRSKALIIGGFLFWLVVFIAPGLYLYGIKTISGGRAFCSFSDHYPLLMARYKLTDVPEPYKYFTYILVCALTNMLVFMRVFKGIFGVLVLRWARCREKITSNHFEPMVLIGFIALAIPHTLVAAFRARYLLKFFIPFVLISVVYWEYCRESSDKPAYLWQARIILALLILTIVLQLAGLMRIIENPYFLEFIG